MKSPFVNNSSLKVILSIEPSAIDFATLFLTDKFYEN